jgi:exopolysaccharide biosynthesis polyprenyl glycosylphosphotransferase
MRMFGGRARVSLSLEQPAWTTPLGPTQPDLRAVDPGHAGRTAGRDAHWKHGYVRSLVLGDALSAVVATTVGLAVRFFDEPGWLFLSGGQPSLVAGVALPFLWVLAMFGARSYEPRFLWVGGEEFRRVLNASVWVLAVVGTGSWALDWPLARGFVCVALPLATVLTLAHRRLRRKAVHRLRRQGQLRQATLLVGHATAVADLRDRLLVNPAAGLDVVGFCVPAGPRVGGAIDGTPVLGGLHEVADVVRRHGIQSVAVLTCPELDGVALRRLGWELEDTDAELLLAPAVTEFAGPRIAIRPLAGLPLLHVERPELSGARRVAKSVFDVALALVGLIMASPVMLAIAAAIKVTSPGPVLFTQDRVGLDGGVYRIYKFRTMVADAHAREQDMMALADGNGVLFKIKHDPRVTPIGRWLRKYSLDELPQLLNVVRGNMSLVGPRPPQPHEASDYTVDVNRRFRVKPGMTGLWQVNGRSDLSWEDGVRIDMRYIENWSFGMDLYILWKTWGAVRRADGAY